jgi:diphthine-ammonia ligase
VTNGPHLARPIELDYEVTWDGTRGHLDIEDARLAPARNNE